MSETIQSEVATSEIKVRSHVGADGILHLVIPTSMSNQAVEVTITVTPVVEPPERTPEELGWSPGFFERTAGQWQGDFVREQPEPQERDWNAFD